MSKTVLVIDDEADVRLFLTTLLEEHGYATLTAENGVEGFEIAERERPDLVTLDLQMPDQTGTDFYRRVTRHPELRTTPIIVVSGLAGRHLAVKDAIAVFDKPIDRDEFIEAVSRALA
ncbi:MAG: response regulator [Candidatus Eiseniibacteriota bacterium]|jgi:CheY-like chemotaxis protein